MKPILITGLPRSGTSMVAGIINCCGIFGGKLLRGNKDNQRGYFENTEIRNKIDKALLKQMNCDPRGQNILPEVSPLIYPILRQNIKNDVLSILKKDGWRKDVRWFFKDAKLSLLWPVWNYAFPDAQWVIVRRPDEQIIESCLNTGFMSGRKTRKSWTQYIEYHKKRFKEIKTNCNARELWSNKIVDSSFCELNEILDWLDLVWNDSIYDLIEPEIYNRGKNG